MPNFMPFLFSLPAQRRALCVLAAACTLSGCDSEHGLTEKLAGFSWPSLWNEAATAPAAPTAPAESAPPAQPEAAQAALWWEQFNDPQLQELIRTALAQGLDMRAADARLQEARANERAADANLFPTLDVALGAQRRSARSGSNTNTSNLVRGTNVGGSELYQAGFDAGWELDLFGRLRNRKDAARALREASEADRDGIQLSLAAEVIRSYVELRLNQTQKSLAAQTATAQSSTVRITDARYKQGVEGNFELSRATAALESTQAEIPRLDALAGAAAYRLDLLLAAENGSTRKTLADEKTIPFITPQLALETPLAVIAQRPDIRAVQRRLVAASALSDAAMADFYPRISLSGAFGYAGGTPGDLFRKSTEVWSFGSNVLFPLFDFGRLRAAMAVSDAQTEQALIAYESSVRTALQEVETAALAYLRETERQERLQKATSANQKAMEIAQRQYKEGILAQLDVLAAQRDYYTTQTQLAQSTANVSTNLVALYKALGRPVVPAEK